MFTEHIPLPDKLTYTKGDKPNEKILTIEPFYHGYGTTIGNALRRVLLSSLTGAAITDVKIKGVDHEFATIDGVKEDVVDIILNLKKLRFKMHTDEPVVLTLSAKGVKEVKAKDFKKNSDIEVVTPDLPIATLSSKDAVLEMEVTVKKGRGYETVDQREEEEKEIGRIAIDAIYTPMVSVGMEVTQARVGQDINYDKLILKIETDGTLTPEEAVDKAAGILVDHFAMLTEKKSKDITKTKKEDK